jgi:DedD protein
MTEAEERRSLAMTADQRLALKERLTGAIILVVLVVLLVPALLTGRRPAAPVADVAGATRSYEIDLVGPPRAPAEDPDRPLPEPESPLPPANDGVPIAPRAVPQNPAPSTPVAVSRPAAPRAPQAVAIQPAAGAAAKPPAAVEARVSVATSNDKPAAARPPSGHTAPAPGGAAVQPAAWAVQLGAFSGRETAAQLVARLRSKGFSAFVLEYRRDGKVLYRVRVGPEQDRNRAIAIAERLNRDGYRATVAPHP